MTIEIMNMQQTFDLFLDQYLSQFISGFRHRDIQPVVEAEKMMLALIERVGYHNITLPCFDGRYMSFSFITLTK